MEKEKLIKELKEKFKKTKKELNFESNFEEIDDIFFIKDLILEKKYVSEAFSRQLCARMTETLNNWLLYFHAIIYPSGNMINNTESTFFKETEKKEIKNVMKKIMHLIKINDVAGITKNKEKEGKFIDEVINEWNANIKEILTKTLKKSEENWKKESEKKITEKDKENSYFG